MFSLRHLPRFFFRRIQEDELYDLEGQPRSLPTIAGFCSVWQRKGRFSTAIILITLLAVLATFSLASRISLLCPPHITSLPSLPQASSEPYLLPQPGLQVSIPLSATTSTRWAPAVLTTCGPATQRYYAPCIAERTRGAVKGEELIYPDFQLREPIFAPSRLQDDRSQWHAFAEGIRERAARCSDEWYCYRGQHGQNSILSNATYTGSPPADSWSDEACMSDGVSLRGIRVLEEGAQLTDSEYAASYPVDSLLVATSPDSWSFQHFLDRITHIVAQGIHLTKNISSVEAITGRMPDGVVAEMWDLLGFDASRVRHKESIGAKEVIFGCRTPLSHPWLSLRSLETFGLNNTRVPLEERKKIVYFSRSIGGANNGGRRILNEEDLLREIRALLVKREQGEELVLFRQADFRSQHELMLWFESNARAVIGPHGGALYNHRWAGIDTLVVEMMPTSRPSQMFWEEASMLSQIYATLVLTSGQDTNMLADIPAVIEILEEHLGRPDSRGPPITEAYRWHAPEVMIPF